MSAVVWIVCYFLLYETFAMIVLEKRKQRLEKENEGKRYKVKGSSDTGLMQKIAAVSLCFLPSIANQVDDADTVPRTQLELARSFSRSQ